MSRYVGSELELFADAVHWKQYWRSRLLPFVAGRVLDVGAGIGANTPLFETSPVTHWTALEPDPALAGQIKPVDAFEMQVINGVLADADGLFDTILYIDVLEHIEADRDECQAAAARLAPGGHLVVLAPAHNALYSEYDRAIGHFRRYNRQMLTALDPAGTRLVRLEYLDAVGMLASLANRLLLRQREPGKSQVQTWDNLMVPVSRLLDPLTGRRLGKTMIAVWQKHQD